MSLFRRGRWLAAAMALAALVPIGCEEQAKTSGPQVRLIVSRDFGREVLGDKRLPLEGRGTAVSLLEEDHDVDLDEFGNVKSIDGQESAFGVGALETATRWNFFVNGVKNPAPPSKLALLDGDVVQMDFEDAIGSEAMRGSVGVFPQPFKDGLVGSRFPVTLECTDGYERACDRVRRSFRQEGIDTSGRAPVNGSPTPRERQARFLIRPLRRSRVYVGPWTALRDRRVPGRVALGPKASGVFADFASDGKSVVLLDPHFEPVRRRGAGTGLVAMTRPTQDGIAWLVTGVDRDGVDRAADAIDRDTLRHAFSIAITPDGIEKLPLPASAAR